MANRTQPSMVVDDLILDFTWLILIVLFMTACGMAGWQYAGQQHRFYLLVLPMMISMALFLIAEIDIPGEGIIRVTPDDIEHVVLPCHSILSRLSTAHDVIGGHYHDRTE